MFGSSHVLLRNIGIHLLKVSLRQNGLLERNRGPRSSVINFIIYKLFTSSNAMAKLVFAKPPNIAVYTGSVSDTDGKRFKKWREMFEAFLELDRYVYFHLDDQQVFNDPWQNNIELLVIAAENFGEEIAKRFVSYLNNDGKIFLMPLNLEIARLTLNNHQVRVNPIDQILDVQHQQFGKCKLSHCTTLEFAGGCNFDGDAFVKTVERDGVVAGELKAEIGTGKTVFLQVNFYEEWSNDITWRNNILLEILRDRLQLRCKSEFTVALPSMTSCLVFSENKLTLNKFRDILAARISVDECGRSLVKGSDLSLILSENGASTVVTDAQALERKIEIPLIFHCQRTSTFDDSRYFENLKTETYGKIVIYSDVISSTMDIINSTQVSELVVAIARNQINGKGRGKHTWLSPEGCAMFSLRLAIPLRSTLGHHLTFMQHLSALAIVEGVKSISGCQDLDIKLKWPNDIYYSNRAKIGGVLVQSTIDSHTLYCTIGCGINVNNGHPTVCLNDMIKEKSPESSERPELHTEHVIAQIISKLEELVSEIQRNGLKSILPLYYSNWLHSDAEVRVDIGSGNSKVARIIGLDDYGFLKVQFVDDPKVFLSVQPDGNSFDMLHNLLIVKNSS